MDRAQTGMEFLFTYGWALLAVVAIVAVVSYSWNAGTPRLIVERCWASPGYEIRDCKSSAEGVQIRLQNILGEELENLTITIKSTPASDLQCFASDTSILHFNNGEESGIITFCQAESVGAVAGLAFDADIKVTYNRPGDSRQYFSAGKIQRRVE